MKEILVLAEHRRGELRDITFEMLSMANRLAGENDMTVTSLFLGHEASDLSDGLKGACDSIVIMDDPELANYNADPYLVALELVLKERKPLLTLIGHTAAGMDLAPALATRLSLPLATDCLEANLVEGRLEVIRQIYGGKINAYLTMKPFDQYLISIRPGSAAAEAEQGKSGATETVPVPSWADLKGRRFLDYLEAELEDIGHPGLFPAGCGQGLASQEQTGRDIGQDSEPKDIHCAGHQWCISASGRDEKCQYNHCCQQGLQSAHF